MLYTIGRTAEYLLACAVGSRAPRPPHKLGRRDHATEPSLFGTPYYGQSYPGGSVWASRADAQAYLDERALHRFAVFGVDAQLDQTADPWAPDATWRDLLVDAPVVALEPAYYAARFRGEAHARRDAAFSSGDPP